VKTGSKRDFIVSVPGIHGGEPVIRGSRVPVRSIVIAAERYEGDLSRVNEAFAVGIEAIQAALAYYAAHRSEIDQIIEEHDRAASHR
jgi:uncharacterized protein (DUF433 family)